LKSKKDFDKNTEFVDFYGIVSQRLDVIINGKKEIYYYPVMYHMPKDNNGIRNY